VQKINLVLHWLLLITLLIVQLLGLASSIGTKIPLQLTKGESVETLVFRVFPAPLNFYVEFSKQEGTIRQELGGVPLRDQKSDRIRFENPGETIKILAEGELGHQLYEMFPGWNVLHQKDESMALRPFWPFFEDDDPASYPYPAIKKAEFLALPRGVSTVKFIAVEAGAITSNEHVKIYVDPPLGAKSVHTGDYLWLGWATLLWPWNLTLLVLYAWFLLRKTRRLPR
jgi:hypothetical protein